MNNRLNYPFDISYLSRKKRQIRRDLLEDTNLIEKKIAILGGSTTAEIKDMLELFLLNDGIKPIFYESEYNAFYDDIMFSNEALVSFAPDIIYIHVTAVNITRYPSIKETEEDIQNLLESEKNKFLDLWDKITALFSCAIIQNNFELPHYRPLGNLDFYDIHGRSVFIANLNKYFSDCAAKHNNLYINDINYLSAWFGLERWYDKKVWYSYKYAMNIDAIPLVANSVASIIRAIFGKSKKCLVVDLDNTLWGGIIGDDGVNGIKIGKELPESEAFTEFQEYVKSLNERGILLAVCSKNDESVAREGFTHPDSALSINNFSAFYANWEPKHESIRNISKELNIGIDSIVFADDNPVEREIVRAQEPQVAVVELDNIANYINILDKAGFFETISISSDDVRRSSLYTDNLVRQQAQQRFENYNDFLISLEMISEINSFSPLYLDRITQLTNKTNQFNLTTKRYTLAEIEKITNDDSYVALYGRLKDKFGDNGLVSVIIGSIQNEEIHINLWLMSCRVLKRGMENAIFDEFVIQSKLKGVKKIIGYYFPTPKNSMVKDLLKLMGFSQAEITDEYHKWSLDVSGSYVNKNKIIILEK
jgi:FkbH-like protein